MLNYGTYNFLANLVQYTNLLRFNVYWISVLRTFEWTHGKTWRYLKYVGIIYYKNKFVGLDHLLCILWIAVYVPYCNLLNWKRTSNKKKGIKNDVIDHESTVDSTSIHDIINFLLKYICMQYAIVKTGLLQHSIRLIHSISIIPKSLAMPH